MRGRIYHEGLTYRIWILEPSSFTPYWELRRYLGGSSEGQSEWIVPGTIEL